MHRISLALFRLLRAAIIVAVDSPYCTRTVSVDAILTAVIVAFDAPYFTRTNSVDAVHTAAIVAVDPSLILALFRLIQYVPLASLRLMHHILLTFFRRWNCATSILPSAFIIQRRHSSAIIQDVLCF